MRLRNGVYMAFLLWPLPLGAVLGGLLPIFFGDRPSVRFFSFIFTLAGFAFTGLWAYYVDHSGLAQRVHDFLGLTRNPFTGRYGSSQKEIEAEAEARRARNSGQDKKKD